MPQPSQRVNIPDLIRSYAINGAYMLRRTHGFAPLQIFDTERAPCLEQDAGGRCASLDAQIAASHGRPEKCHRRRLALAVQPIGIEVSESLRSRPVEIFRDGQTALTSRGHEGGT